MGLQSTGSDGCASGGCSVHPKVPAVAAALALDGCGPPHTIVTPLWTVEKLFQSL